MIETWVMATAISIGAITVLAALLLYSKGFGRSKVHCCKVNDTDEKATKVKTSQGEPKDVDSKGTTPVTLAHLDDFNFDKKAPPLAPPVALPVQQGAISTKVPPTALTAPGSQRRNF
jgi:hypothetical protein